MKQYRKFKPTLAVWRSEESLEKRRKYNREYNKRNKDKIEEYRLKNSDKIKQKRKEWYESRGRDYYAKRCQDKMPMLLYNSAKSRANELGLPFDITVNDIVIPEFCPYLKLKITYIHGKGRQWTNPSIDRIVPNLGYVKGNIQVISVLANTMKSIATVEQLLQFAKSILELHGCEDSMGRSEPATY